MLAFGTVADVLGLPVKEVAARSPFGLISRIEDGLPIAALERVAHLLAPGDAQFKYRLIPKATYERRKTAHRLSSNEGTRLARVARVWSVAVDVWQNEEEVRDFLFRPHPDDTGQTPDRRRYPERVRRRNGCRYPRKAEVRQRCVTPQILDRSLWSFRIGDPNGTYPIFDATGSTIAPGRWNTPRSPIIYTSEHYSTALLEKLVHGSGHLPPNQHYVEITIPHGLSYEVFSPPSLPGWDTMPATVSKAFGERWCAEKRSVILMVPSVVARLDSNVLINPAHPRVRKDSNRPPPAGLLGPTSVWRELKGEGAFCFRYRTTRLGEIDAKTVAPPLVSARHLSRSMAKPLLNVAFVDFRWIHVSTKLV